MKIVLCDSLKEHPLYAEKKSYIEDFYKNIDSDKEAVLFYDQGVVKLKSKLFSTVFCDFTDKSFIREVRQSFGRSEGVYSFLKPVAKKGSVKICDMTVGMGKDFFKFILAGHRVVGFERNPVFYYLVKDGLSRFLNSPDSALLKTQFRVTEFDAELRLGEARFEEGSDYNLIYYDPMFEDKSKKAAPKKGMQALKYLNLPFQENDKEECLKAALAHSKATVIFKSSGVSKDFPFYIKKEQKGKGFSYIYL